ncbi:acyltransferase family protein [Muricoccus vinaceus]|uniref:Acyltransferase family protein n=1 Tax=Muricoccus vinaceus TaxID=424704 RepID=A0ABV6IM00_9PROT
MNPAFLHECRGRIRHLLPLPVAQGAHLPYRADIDGLRAIAVLSVVAFHADIGALGGGYVGVDVFLVISGFLIGSLVHGQVCAGTFTFRDFYERRIRRILPAFLVMLAGTLLLGARFAMPAEMTELGRSSLAALLSLSNIHFQRNTDYFDTPAESQPLLHTWSLAVEEQFYLLLPPAIVLVHRFMPRALRPFVLASAAASLALSMVAIKAYPDATFYLLPTRAWELLLGMLVGLYRFPLLENARVRSAVAALGAAMVLTAILAFTEHTTFPGTAALLPCLGAACVIAAGGAGPTAVGRALSARPLVLTGLMSYSIYLWHWPVIVFQRADAFLVSRGNTLVETLVILAASILAGAASWHFVEKPFRSRQRVGRAALFRAAGGGSAALAAAAAVVIGSGGYPSRFPPGAREAAAFLDYNPRANYRAGTCMISSGFTFQNFRKEVCLARSASERNFLLLGDSHAAHLWRGLEQIIPDANIMQATASGCRPTLRAAPRAWNECRMVVDHALREYLPSNAVEALVLAAKWEQADLPGLAETLDWARGRGVKVILLGPIVQYEAAVPRLVANSLRSGHDLLGRHRLSRLKRLDAEMRALAQSRGARYVSLWDIMCAQANCLATTAEGRPLQFDYGHVTAEGSRRLAELVIPAMGPGS